MTLTWKMYSSETFLVQLNLGARSSLASGICKQEFE